jgi:hypothetical protein
VTSNQSLNVENKHHHPLTTEKRILDESDGPAPKKSKKHSDVDFNSIYRESSALAGEPSTSPTNKSVIHQKQSFSKVIVEKHGEALSPFDAHPDDLKRYAFVSTLNFPAKKMRKNLSQYFDTLFNGDIREALSNAQLPCQYRDLMQEMIKFRKVLDANAFFKAKRLLEEILFHNLQFLIAFTIPKPESPSPKKDYGYSNIEIMKLRKKEEDKLLEWLIEMFHNGHQSQASFSSASEEVIEFARCHSRSSLYEIISGYFQGNAGSEEIISYRWRNKGRKGKPHLCTNVSENSAITTKAAMYALGNYYKSTHPTKWKNFFPYDFHFVNVFAFLRHN